MNSKTMFFVILLAISTLVGRLAARTDEAVIGKLLNLSTRVNVGVASEVAIAGLIITGSEPKKLVIRALGPSLPVPGALADPILELHKADGSILVNDNWKENQAEVEQTQLAPTRDEESAIVVTLPPGAHTAILTGKNNATGIGLIEIYNLEPNGPAVLANLSTRGRVATEGNVLIAGAIAGGGAPSRIVVRGLGPSLTAKGVGNALENPTLQLVDRNGSILASNDNWKDTAETIIQASGLAPTDVNEAAILATLPPDSYTAILRGVMNSTGVGLMEVYRLPDVVTQSVPANGGTVEYPGVASASFSPGTIPENQPVTISVTSDTETAMEFVDTAAIFAAGPRMPFEVRIKVGSVQPQNDVSVTFNLPQAFRDSVPADSEIRAFARNHWDADGEVLDTFELLPERFLPSDVTATVVVPSYIFTTGGSPTGDFEAVLVVGTTPTRAQSQLVPPLDRKGNSRPSLFGENPMGPSPDAKIYPDNYRNFLRDLALADTCGGSSLAQPLDNLFVTSPFGLRILNGVQDFHHGTDYRAMVGTPVKAMHSGKVKIVKVEQKADGTPKGYGQYIMIQGPAGSTIYGHLTTGSVTVAVNDMVNAGDLIALSGNSGPPGTPAHLHVDYAPRGDIFNNDNKINPAPCIGATVTGSITVRDNGTLADDAFEVSINGQVVCSTAIGQQNTCAVGNLRPGSATLGIRAIVAPDDVGTYEVSLADGLTFSDGTTVRSGTVPEGGVASFQIIIPNLPK